MTNRRAGKMRLAIVAPGALALFLVFLFWPRSASLPLSQLPPAEQERRRADVYKLEERAKDIGQQAKQKKKVSFRVTVTEEQLNTILQERLKSGQAPIYDVQATLSPGVVTATGTADYKGVSVPATLSGTFTAQNGKVIFHTSSLSLSRLPAPGILKEQVERDINKRLSQGLTEAPLKVEEVTIEQGQATISGTTD